LPLDAEQRRHGLREVFNALRRLVRSGAHWRMQPHDLPHWTVVYQQTQRCFKAGCPTFPLFYHHRTNHDSKCRILAGQTSSRRDLQGTSE
jgi:transposase